MSRYHPDKHEGNELQELAALKLLEINEAHAVLSDPVKRAAYDAELRDRGVDTSPVPQMPKRPVSPVGVLIVVVGIFVALRFVRGFRPLLLLAAVIAISWFGPRLVQRLRAKR